MYYVCLHYADGTVEKAGSEDTLTEEDIKYYVQFGEDYPQGDCSIVVKISLQDEAGNIYEEYDV